MENKNELLNKAIAFASRAHNGQKRKLAGSPYILHPIEAAAIVSSITTDQEILAAIVLHDTIEDCDVSPDEIKEVFGSRVCSLVLHETEDKMRGIPPQDTWDTRKKSSLEKLRKSDDPAVKLMWLGDKLSNLR